VTAYVLRLKRFYQAYSTPVMCYCHVTGGGKIRFQIWGFAGAPAATP